MRCLACQHFTFKHAGKDFIELGYGNCANDVKYIMYHSNKDRQCEKHEALPDEEVEKREKWLDDKRNVTFTG